MEVVASAAREGVDVNISSQAKGRLLTFAGVVCLSPDALLVRLAAVDAWTVLFWRGLFLSLVMGALALAGRRSDAGWPRLSGAQQWLVLLFVVGNITFVQALANTAVTNVLVILGAAPLFGALASAWLLGEHLLRRTWLASVLVIVGLLVVFQASLGSGAWVGDAFALVAALATGLTYVVLRARPETSIFAPVSVAALGVALISAVWAVPLAPTPVGFAALGALGFFVLPSAFYLTSRGPAYIPAPEVSLIMLLEMILGPLWVWMALGELPSVQVALAGAFVLVVIALHAAWPLRTA